MAENNIEKKLIGLAFDGTGLGRDGNIWGGEFLISDFNDFERVGHLNYMKMPGGEKAIKHPWRMAVSYLYHLGKSKTEIIDILNLDNLHRDKNKNEEKNGENKLEDSGSNERKLVGEEFAGKDVEGKVFDSEISNEEEINIIFDMLEKNLNCPLTSSMGRLFDIVSALVGLRKNISYQAQAAIELEAVANSEITKKYRYLIREEKEEIIVNTDPIVEEILLDLKNGVNISNISGKFHNTVIEFSFEICKLLRQKNQINEIALSGGVFQNEFLLKGLYKKLTDANFKVYTHSKVPCNDGGIALGQLVVTSHLKRRNK